MGAQQDTYNSCLSRIDRMHLTALIVSYSTPAEGVSGWGPECIVPQPPSLGNAPRPPGCAAYARRTPRHRLLQADYC